MLRIPSCNNLSSATNTHLATQQADINQQSSYQTKVERAKSLWQSKESSPTKKTAFAEIKAQLKELAVAKLYCNYCEHGETYDIEHIFPKSLFPERAFQWENYLYACKACNMGEKVDKFEVFPPVNGTTTIDIRPKRKPRIYTQPPSAASVLINPRIEDPMDFLVLDLAAGTFISQPNINAKDTIRANYTIKLIQLNEREGLVQARQNICKLLWQQLQKYAQIKQTSTLKELQTIVPEYSFGETFQNLEQDQQNLLTNIQNTILRSTHQTVWAEMKRQRQTIPQLNDIFTQVPEALEWALS